MSEKAFKNIDPLASFEEKKTDLYGLNIARMISQEWFNGQVVTDGASCAYMNRREYVRNKRKFVRGEVDLKKYKDHLSKSENDLSYLNLDFRYINLAEKFCRIVSNGISDENYILDIRSMDKISISMKQNKQDEYRKYMASSTLLQSAVKELGIDLMPKTFVPEDEEEMEIIMQIKDRPKVEIGEEVLIEWIKQTNNWRFIEEQKNKDIVDVGLIVARVWTDKNDGVKLDYVDPEFYVHSAVRRNDFSDKFYEGVVDTITVGDFMRESGYGLETVREISNKYGFSNLFEEEQGLDQMLGKKLQVLRFAWKTVKTIKYKQKLRKGEVVKLSGRTDSYAAPKRSDVGELSKTLDCWFEGNHVIGTDCVYGWKECENMYDDVMNKALSPFVTYAYDIYDNKLRSFTCNIEVIADRMQLTALKIQHLISELTPDLKEVDLDMLADLGDGKGGSKGEVWKTALDLMGAKGVVFKKRIDLGDEGGIKESFAVNPKAMQQGTAITILLNTWAHDYNLIRENTGVNPARDGMMGQDALVGINQMAQLASNTVTKNIVETTIAFNLKICEVISTRIQAIYHYKEASRIREVYNNVIGKRFVDHLSIMKDRHLSEFGFTFNMVPTSLEIQSFSEDLGVSLQSGTITPYIKIEVQEAFRTNPKLARELLKYYIKKTEEKKIETEMMLSKEKSKNDAMAAQAAEQAKGQSYQHKKQVDLMFESELAKIRIMEKEALLKLEAPQSEQKFQRDAHLAQITAMGKSNLEVYNNDRKDKRSKQEATQQSEMISQRNNKQPAINFEDSWSQYPDSL